MMYLPPLRSNQPVCDDQEFMGDIYYIRKYPFIALADFGKSTGEKLILIGA